MSKTKMKNAEFANQIMSAFLNAQRLYDTRNGINAVAVSVTQADLKSGLKTALALSEAQVSKLQSAGLNPVRMIEALARTGNVKINRRLPEFLQGISSGSVKWFKGSARTALLAFVAVLAGAKTRDDFRTACMTVRDISKYREGINPDGIEKVKKIITAVSCNGTFASQFPVAVKHNGILNAMGIITHSEENGIELTQSAITRALTRFIESLTDSQIEELTEKV